MSDERCFLLPTTPKQWREAVEYFCDYAASPQGMAHGIVLRDMLGVAESRQWVPVSERLPPDGVYVLGRETIHEAFLVVLRKDGGWFYAQGRIANWRVTHWMPLPEPPQ
jgi:hypothetical protein